MNEPATESQPVKQGASPDATRRAFAGLTLFGALLLFLAPFLPWAQMYNQWDGWFDVHMPWVLEGGKPSDGMFALGIAAVCAGIGGFRTALGIPDALRALQFLLGAGAAAMGAYDWSNTLTFARAAGPGIMLTTIAGVIIAIGALPLKRS